MQPSATQNSFTHDTAETVASLALTFFFGLFLIAAPPHRVHHFFEEHAAPGHSTAHTHEHGEDSDPHDHKHAPASKSPDCALQSVAQHAHAKLSQPTVVGDIGRALLAWLSPAPYYVSIFHYSVSHPRAPPAFP